MLLRLTLATRLLTGTFWDEVRNLCSRTTSPKGMQIKQLLGCIFRQSEFQETSDILTTPTNLFILINICTNTTTAITRTMTVAEV